VSKFVEQSLGALVLKRGDSITSRTWADMGVRLRPEFVNGVGSWMAPLGGQSASAGGAAAGGAAEVQTVFQMLPQAVPGLTEYTIDVDGQVLRYRNGKASWAHFVWPGPGTPGVKITGVSYDGTPITFFQEPGRFGLEKMINSAQRRRIDDGVFELSWAKAGASVAVQLRIISNADTPAAAAPATSAGGAGAASLGALPAIIAGPVEPVAAEGAL
jgi:type VI secretion system protein ImpL